MRDDPSPTYCLALLEGSRAARPAEIELDPDQLPAPGWSYQARMGRHTIVLDAVEYRILKLLASRPYHAFSSQHIAQAVSTERQPVTAQTLQRHITSLRDKLGFYADYVQSVPYIGYRFKA